MKKINELIEAIKANKRVLEFKHLEKVINEDTPLKNELIELFELQQEMVQLKVLQKYKMLEIVEKTYQEKRLNLETNPLVSSYLELQEEVNYLINQIKDIIETELKNSWKKLFLYQKRKNSLILLLNTI